jgi:hypothetical protein
MAHHPGLIYLLSSTILSGLWFALVAVVWALVRWQLGRMRAAHGRLPRVQGFTARLDYTLAFMLLPAAFVLGLSNLRRPQTALFGRDCLAIGLGNVSLILLTTCAAMTAAGFLRPELLP